jgi:hypothetical protein
MVWFSMARRSCRIPCQAPEFFSGLAALGRYKRLAGLCQKEGNDLAVYTYCLLVSAVQADRGTR